jgi:hypothetical protein
MQTLDPADASLLPGAKPERSGPTVLERLMTDNHVQTPRGPAVDPAAVAGGSMDLA